MAPLGKRRDASSDNAGFTLGQPLIQTISNFLSGLIALLMWDLGLRVSHKEKRSLCLTADDVQTGQDVAAFYFPFPVCNIKEHFPFSTLKVDAHVV